MPWYQKKIISGNVTEIYYYFSLRRRGKDSLPRSGKVNMTSEEKQVINIREARMKLTRLINTNFTHDDGFIRLSYRKNVDDETSIKEFRKFMRRLKYYIRKNNLPELKYVAVTERGKGKPHHHIVMNFTDSEVIRQLWGNGGMYITNLWTEDYEGLAMYITKETIRNEHGKRWSQSRNLQKPIEKTKELKQEPRKMPQTPKGYKLLESVCTTTVLGHRVWYVKTVRNGSDFYDSGG